MEAASSLRVVDEPGEDPWDALCLRVRAVASMMGLRDYAVEVMTDPPTREGALAEVECAQMRKHVRFRFRDDFLELSPEEQHHALIHECLHPHFRQLSEHVYGSVSSEIGGAAFRTFWRVFERDMEEAVDSIATVLARYVPEPPEQGGG